MYIGARQPDHADRHGDNRTTTIRTSPTRSRRIPVAQTPYTLKFFELINSPQGPWLQMLQRVYYTDDPIDEIIADAKAQMEELSCAGGAGSRRATTRLTHRRPLSVRMKARTQEEAGRRRLRGAGAPLRPRLHRVPVRADVPHLVDQRVAARPAEVRRPRQLPHTPSTTTSSGGRSVHAEVHGAAHPDPDDRRLPARPAPGDQHADCGGSPAPSCSSRW